MRDKREDTGRRRWGKRREESLIRKEGRVEGREAREEEDNSVEGS